MKVGNGMGWMDSRLMCISRKSYRARISNGKRGQEGECCGVVHGAVACGINGAVGNSDVDQASRQFGIP
jgi:hypothetical protein